MKTTFAERKSAGHVAEELFQRDMQNRNFDVLFRAPLDKSFKDYDFKISASGKIFTAEIKNDLNTTSSNLAVEYTYRGKPSGIWSSKADLYFILNCNRWFVADTEALRDYVTTQKPPKVKNTRNSNEVFLHLIPKKLYEPYSATLIQDFFILTPKVEA